MKPALATNLDAAVWAACPYVKQWVDKPFGKHTKCKRCPQWEVLDGDKVQRLCRGAVEEILKPALAAYQSKGGSE